MPLQPLRARPTPLLRLGRALVKLETLRPSAGADDRALPLWDGLSRAGALRGKRAVFAGTAGAALAAGAWARAAGVELAAVLHGTVAHEAREALRLWGMATELVPGREAALARAAERARAGELLLPPLDGDEAAAVVSGALGSELVRDLDEAHLSGALLVAPGGARAALLGALAALRFRWPGARAIALCAVSAADELPELPLQIALPQWARAHVEVRPVARAQAASARALLAREHGLSAGHACALAALLASDAAPGGGVALALLTSAGEREFSLDPTLPA